MAAEIFEEHKRTERQASASSRRASVAKKNAATTRLESEAPALKFKMAVDAITKAGRDAYDQLKVGAT